MAQIIKHRRGSIDSLKGSLARKGELVIATGSIGNMNGPWVFVGDSDAAGAYKPTSQIYRGNTAPTISNLTYGSTLDGTPFYSITSKSLFILDSTGNVEIDLTGNIEGNTISGVTINNLESTNVTASFVSGAFFGDAGGLYNIPASGVTNLDLSRIVSGSATASISPDNGLQVNVNISTTNDLFVTGTIHVGDGTPSQIYYDGMLFLEDTSNGVQMSGGNGSFFQIQGSGYAQLYANQEIDISANGGSPLWMWAEGGGDVWIGSYDNQTLHLNNDGGEGNVDILNGGGNVLNVYGDILQTGSLYTSKIVGTGSLFLQPNDQDSRYFEIYNTSPSDTHIKANGGYSYFGDDTNYLKIDDGGQIVTVNAENGVNVYANFGNINISSYDGNTLYLNTDGGEGDVQIGNNNNNINGYSNATNFQASNYAQLESNNSYIWVDSDGAYTQNDNNGLAGFTARPNGIAEVTGALFIQGDTNINGDTSVTGAFVVSNGSATFDQGLVAQNSNMLLTSGSNLIVQDGGNVTVDYIQGNTQSWNYLALNGGVLGAPDVELGSVGNISLWAEGGSVNVTGSLNVTGDIIFSGSINLGDFTGDTINFNGEVSSSILPQTGSSFDLGSSGQTWANVYADTAHFANISLNTISFSGLTEGRVLLAGPNGSIVDSGSFTYGYNGDFGDYVLEAPIIRATNDGNGTNFLIGNDMWLGDVNEANATRFMGSDDNGIAKIYFNTDSDNNYINAYYSDVTLSANSSLNLQSQNGTVNIESYDGWINLNDNSGNNIGLYGNTYVGNNRTLYVNKLRDNSDNTNYLELYGWNTDDGYWWEGGDGRDTTLLNDDTANLNILARSGKVNIDASDSVNIHTNNGFNVTGSMTVSDASGVFNSSLIAYNSDLTLDGGSNINMNDGAHLYFNNGCGDIYYNSGPDELTLYNDCGDIRFRNVTRSEYDMYFEDGNTLYTNYIYGYNGGNLYIGANDNVYIYSDNTHYVEIYASNNEDGTNRLKVQESGVSFETYDYTSDKTHKVNLDNLGNLSFENVQIGITGSMAVSGSFDTYGPTHIHNDLYVSGNLSILGSGSVVHISSSQVDIGTNIINLNTYAPFERFAGISVYDSGSNAGVTGSLFWDSTNDVWIYANPSGSNYASARLISGPQNTGSLGDELGLTNGHFPIATGDDHISDSLLTYQGTTLALNTNKFTVDSDNGDTLIHGNFTIEGVGAEDKGDYGSYIVFRNEDNVLGFVDTSDTENVTDRLLGYNASSGVLEFSSLIDGGTY
jgi:hypothetical protein